ncbi:MAG: hypothetical protein PF692_09210 [Kiritimatiellae bacterium]|nr:hypothetical protein [Kiritimatiellia bacterium]
MIKTRLMIFGFLAMILVSTFTFGYSGGSGVPSDPYLIADKADLLELGATTADYDKCFKMTADIDLSGTNFTKAVIAADSDNSTFLFVGTRFTGVFNGNGCVIANLTIDSSALENDFLGLFGYIGYSGQVIELGIKNVRIIGGDNSVNIGSICGTINNGSIRDCYSTGYISGGDNSAHIGGLCGYNYHSLISDCYSKCSMSGGKYYVGGICGGNFVSATISDCYATGDVSADGESYYLGGLCGENYKSTIKNCYSTGNVSGGEESQSFGGLCGRNRLGTILTCYSTGVVVGGDTPNNFGGLLGENYYGTTSFSFWDTETSGMTTSSGGIGKTTAEMQMQSTFMDVGWNFDDTWGMNGYPKLQWQDVQSYILTVTDGTGDGSYAEGTRVDITADVPLGYEFVSWIAEPGIYTNNIGDLSASNTTFTMATENVTLTANYYYTYSGGTGTESDPYLISNKADLLELGATTADYDKCFKMTADIDLSGTNFTKAVIASSSYNSVLWLWSGTEFSGTFDGDGHVISNLMIAGNGNYIGLFGRIGSGGNICNLTVDGNLNVPVAYFVGGLVGYNNAGTVSRCFSKVSIDGFSYAGGLCGYNMYGNIENSYSTGSVTAGYHVGGFCGDNEFGTVSNSYSTGSVDGLLYVGGLCGDNEFGKVLNSYSTGSVFGLLHVGGLCGDNDFGTILNSYSTGSVDGAKYVGGLCGDNYIGTINSCYSTGKVIFDSYGGGLVGYNRGSIISSFWDIQTSGMTTSDGGIGKTTAEMQTESTFTDADWNFVDTWRMVGYPTLQWQNIAIVSMTISGATYVDEGESTQYICTVLYDNGYTNDVTTSATWSVNSPYATISSTGILTALDIYTNQIITISADYSENGVDTNAIYSVTLRNVKYSGGSGTEVDPYLIENKGDFLELSANIDDYGKCFKMISDVDLTGESFTSAVIAPDTSTSYGYQGTKFTGSFDGDGHKICNLTISGSLDYVSLFGYVGSGATISNLGITDSSVTGKNYAGGLIGYNEGIVENCYSWMSVSSSAWYVGGFVGINYGTIIDCYSIGSVSGVGATGGFCGWSSGGISDCFWNTQTSGRSTSDGGTGKTTALMQLKSTFSSWNFVEIWYMNGYPQLQNFETVLSFNAWLNDYDVPLNEQGYSDDPAGDGIQNLLKYAIGLSPLHSCSASDVMELLAETNGFSVIYRKSKETVDVELFPTWTDSLLVTNWGTNGFVYTMMSETSSNETWKATLPMTNECGYIRLKATIED